MADHKIRDDFNALRVVKAEKYMQKRGLSESGYLKTSFVEIASAVEKMVLLVCPNFEKDDATTSDKSIIHDVLILNLLLLKTVNNFDASRLFGL